MDLPPLKIFRAPLPMPLRQFMEDLERAEQIMPFEEGPFACSIPLVETNLLHPAHAGHYNSSPSANLIHETAPERACPAFTALFDLFNSPIAAFRLVRREPHSTYELHEDTDRGQDVWRFQVPLISGPAAVICLSDKRIIEEGRSDPGVYTPEKFRERFVPHRVEPLMPGWIYGFNVDFIHTLHNGENTYRVTLLMDVILGERGLSWWRTNSSELPITPVS